MDNKKHGRWLARYPLGEEFGVEYMCSNCRGGTFGASNDEPICKHCGAIMDIETEYVDIDDVITTIEDVCKKQLWGTPIRQAFLDAIKTIPTTIVRKK